MRPNAVLERRERPEYPCHEPHSKAGHGRANAAAGAGAFPTPRDRNGEDAVPVAFSHNPEDLLGSLWVVVAFAVVLAFFSFMVAAIVRAVRAARRRQRPAP